MNHKVGLKCWLFVSLSAFILLIGNGSGLYGQGTPNNEANNYLRSRGEVFFKFNASPDEIHSLTRFISIDKVKNDTVYAYANRKEFEYFLRLNKPFQVLLPPSHKENLKIATTADEMKAWDSYPTYVAYLDLMASFATDFPGLCSIHEFGTSTNGRKLLFAKISDNVDEKEAEPEFMFSSSMHGDELTGCILSLRLIDYLLNNYDTDPFIKRLVDSVEIWINPLANPDGTYYGGNSSVADAIRGNANYIDLNRNFPDPTDGQHPDGEAWQQETEACMDFFQAHNFVFSANYHGGAEVMNYPWDNYFRRHADDTWFQHVSLNYADTVKLYGGSDYFSDIATNGITNGYDWYAVAGGRQDYMTYFCHGREITIEVSEVKLPLAANLPSYWNYNYRAMLRYIENCLYGIKGIITDSATHEPIRAKLEVIGHDADSSQIYSDLTNGNYHRMIEPGTYDLKYSAPGYKNKTIEGIIVEDYSSQVSLNVALAKGSSSPIHVSVGSEVFTLNCHIDESMLLRFDLPESGILDVTVFDINGRIIYATHGYFSAGYSELQLPQEQMADGLYLCRVGFKNSIQTIKISNSFSR